VERGQKYAVEKKILRLPTPTPLRKTTGCLGIKKWERLPARGARVSITRGGHRGKTGRFSGNRKRAWKTQTSQSAVWREQGKRRSGNVGGPGAKVRDEGKIHGKRRKESFCFERNSKTGQTYGRQEKRRGRGGFGRIKNQDGKPVGKGVLVIKRKKGRDATPD